ncbi:MAG: Sulfur oxidation protein SoxZ [uncultured Sulfurovum sp.]|uniref:Sulfur oxidation protein SoxZ n=1 Tax=uncultured Sulfurovum sp. TaxID=269237 RepID=A0A6S6SXW1_9BACT|nr:MAG: Sulfur oxidation protein SoxZ [uncultured Sulfurovum sp.]
MKIKAKIKDDVLKCTVQVTHAMTTDVSAKEEGGEANYITNMIAKVGDRVVIEISTSQFVSKDPDFKFQVKANEIKKGDEMTVTWTDKSGKSETGTGKIK